MKKETIYLDLTEMKVSRPQLRRLEKNLQTSSEFVKKKGKVFFFSVDPFTKAVFFQAVGQALENLGNAYVRELKYEWELGR
ncbi:hypothetical protein [Pleomorphovibrio marinus]|uniref:hypothetical protein n=1 Tax=Pleomorphovibrio marinus TaxID=2164132 RepID=UPI000E0AC164|nr:hypothetical protein [Pleomorphovibrio marinus]